MVLKKKLLDIVCSEPIQSVVNPLYKNNAIVFMLHRFASEKFSTEGHDPAFLSKCLDYLKVSGRKVVSLDELFQSINGKSEPIDNAVVFTIDDGFLDQAEIGARIFCDHDCPVAICVITELVAQRYWLAESRIAFLLENATLSIPEISFESKQFYVDIKSHNGLKAAINQLVFYCKSLPLQKAEEFIAELSAQLGINLPTQTPLKYRGMNWEMIKSLEKKGVSFCAHTEKHPALSAELPQRAREEIFNSFNCLKDNTANPSQIFCYPTGRPAVDYTARDIQYVADAGFVGGISAVPGYVDLKHLESVDVFSVPRFSFPGNMRDFKQIIHHVELMKDWLRGLKNPSMS